MRRGIGVSIATGRLYSGTRPVARELGLEGPVGCLDGSVIVDVGTDRELTGSWVEPPTVVALQRVLAELPVASFVFASDAIYYDVRGAPYLDYVRIWSRDMFRLGDALRDGRWATEPCLGALAVLGDEASIRAAHAAMVADHAERLQAALFSVGRPDLSGTWVLIARAAGVSKATAVAYIARHHGVDPSEVVVVGDWFNDVPMLRAAGRSFVMAQAPDAVKIAATDELVANAETGGGIAEAALRSGLL